MTTSVKYNIVITLINLITNATSKYEKTFEEQLTADESVFYNNDHILIEHANILDLFKDEINLYSAVTGTPIDSITIDEFEIVSLTDKIDTYFKNDEYHLDLSPIIMCYVHPKFEPLKVPKLIGMAYNSHSIIWSWPEDMEYAHILVDAPIDSDNPDESHIIAHIPIGQTTYTENNLEPDTAYTRRLINYTSEQTSIPSASVTVQTETLEKEIALSEYNIAKVYDFSVNDEDRNLIDENLQAFHSGVGDFNDLKVYKRMDTDFYQKFKAYFEIVGRRLQKEKRYDQVGFNYKIHLEALQEIEEQEGEVTFDVNVYPREWVRFRDYFWSTWPVLVKSKLTADVFLRKGNNYEEEPFDINTWKPKFEEKWEEYKAPKIPKKIIEEVIEHPGETGTESTTKVEYYSEETNIIIALDTSGSMDDPLSGGCRYDIIRQATCDFLRNLSNAAGPTNVNNIKITLIEWAGGVSGGAKTVGTGASIQATIDYIEGNQNGLRPNWVQGHHDVGNYTCFKSGQDECNKYSGLKNPICIFITDGFSNLSQDFGGGNGTLWCYATYNGKDYYNSLGTGNSHGTNTSSAVFNSIKKVNFQKSYFIFINGKNYYDSDYNNFINGTHGNDIFKTEFKSLSTQQRKDAVLNFAQKVIDKVRSEYGANVYYPGDNSQISSAAAFQAALQKALDTLVTATTTVIPGKPGTPGWTETIQKEVVDTDPKDETKDGIPWHWDGSEWYPKNKNTEKWHQIDDDTWEKFIGMLFDGWEKVDEGTKIPKYSLDGIRYVHIEVQLPDCVFSSEPAPPYMLTGNTINQITPVTYDRDAMRAVISGGNIITTNSPTSELCQDLFQLIWDQVVQTPLYNQGYNLPIGLIPEGKELGMDDCDGYLIRNCYIQNTYNYSDKNGTIPTDWGINDYEDGLDGSVNVSAQIDKMEDFDYYGDDCYMVQKGDKVWMTGFTDAIIFDGTLYPESELNAYDMPADVVVDGNQDYTKYLHNRKNFPYTYQNAGGTIIPKHCLDIIEIGKDIKLKSNIPNFSNNMKKAKDWIIIDPMLSSYTVIAENYRMYQSPILNYRFNIEDPDSKTSLYEILPDCDPKSNYFHIVILHVYYARNVYITNINNYVESFGNDPIATTSSDYIPLVEYLYKWTKKEHKGIYGNDNGWYIDNYLWFMSKPMKKTIPYYDELPSPGMGSYYGLVNGRYRSDSQDGKLDLVAQMHKFNIPTTVTDKYSDTVRIYLTIQEIYPDDALVYYKWEKPWNNIDSITDINGNGDYVTFSSDTITLKDVEYKEVVATINYENQEVFNSKTQENIYSVKKPETILEYENYYLNVKTDNSDVIALRYPTEITFDEVTQMATVPVAFKGVVNATSKWSPLIHNGFYYLNQHEYYAYSEFDVEANFETESLKEFKSISGYISINVDLRKLAAPEEHYNINKCTRSELLQDEDKFTWKNQIDANDDIFGLTIKPKIDGEYYKEFYTYMYTSPQLIFPNILTSVGALTVDYIFEDGSNYLPMEIRSFDNDNGVWFDWVDFANGSVPLVDLSNAYQIRFPLQASTTNTNKYIEDYLCCYLDWKEDSNDHVNCTNIVTITDYMTSGPFESDGVFISKIFDFGCESEVSLQMFCTNFGSSQVRIYVAATTSDQKNHLLLENASWKEITNSATQGLPEIIKAKYFRYKIVIPYGEKVYWVHKVINTLETHYQLPYIKSITFSGSYQPSDVVKNFINIESFEIPTDGQDHEIFPKLLDLISADVVANGFDIPNIEYISVQCTTPDITINFNHNIELQWPDTFALETNITANAEKAYDLKTLKSPFIISEQDAYGNDFILIHGTPQQFAPITVETSEGEPMTELFENSDLDLSNGFNSEHMEFMKLHETHIISDEPKYISLKRNDYELVTLKILLNNIDITNTDLYDRINHLIIFKDNLNVGDKIDIEYRVPNSFLSIIDREQNTTIIYLYRNINYLDTPTNINEYSIYNVPTIKQLFDMKQTYSYSILNPSNHANVPEELKWQCDGTQLLMEDNVGTFNILLNPEELIPKYHHECIIKSESVNNGYNGIVIGYAKDPWDGYHTLSLILNIKDLKINIDLYYDFNNYGYVVNHHEIDYSTYTSLITSDSWEDFKNGFLITIDKDENMLSYSVESIDDNTLNIPLETFDLNSNLDTMDFSEGVLYGYCNMSQPKSYFNTTSLDAWFVSHYVRKYKVYFETGKVNNKFIADDLSFNPIYRTDYKGFVYLTDEHNEPYKINIYCNPKIIKCGGYDKVDISVEVLDILDNPIINKPIAIDCNYGLLYKDSDNTDMNGVIHLVYESSTGPSTDTITAKVRLESGELLQESINIINEK